MVLCIERIVRLAILLAQRERTIAEKYETEKPLTSHEKR